MDNKNKNQQFLTNLATDILAAAKKQGATNAETGGFIDIGLSTNVRLGKVDTIEFNRDKSIAITIYKDKRKGSVTTSDFSKQAIDSAIEAAFRIAAYTEEDPYAGLADPNQLTTNIPDLDLYHPKDISFENAIEIAKNCEQIALEYDPKITNSEGASFSKFSGYQIYANSHGFIGYYAMTRYSIYCAVIGGERETMQRDFDFTVARNIDDLIPYQTVAKNAAYRTLARLGAKKIKTCKVPVIFTPLTATSIIGSFISAISGGNLYRKSSFLLDQINKKIFPEFVEIYEEPHLLRGLGSAPFDSEGVATKKHNLISQGILQSYVLNSYSARKLGLTTTGNGGGVHNVFVKPSCDYNLPELIQTMDRGLIVSELMGHGTNIVTGDYSHGAAGFWVENGVIKYPVEEITIASNLKEMFTNIVAIANDIDKRKNIITGSILINNMTVAGN